MTLIGDHPIGPTDGADTSCARRETLVPPTPGAYAGILVCELHSSNHRTREQMRVPLKHLRGGGKRGKERDARQATLYRPQRGGLERNALHIRLNHTTPKTARGKPSGTVHRKRSPDGSGPCPAPPTGKGTWGGRVKAGAQTKRGNVSSRAPHRPNRAD